MKNWQVMLIVTALLAAALLNGGIYQIAPAGTSGSSQSATGYRINRFTGTTWRIEDGTEHILYTESR